MTQCVGDIDLVKFVGFSSDGTVHTLLGWPRQVGSRTTGLSNIVSSRDTEWKPYKLVKVGPQLTQCPQSLFPRGYLKYHPGLGGTIDISRLLRYLGSLPVQHLCCSTLPLILLILLKPPVNSESVSKY